ncbi:MAG: transketolase [Desulfobacteraceae bacterium]|jgi:transketolase
MKNGFSSDQTTIDALCVNTIRTLAIDAIEKANSGHPGAPMGLASAGYLLWTRHLKHNPINPNWPDRDRFVLSGGHASMLLYSLLHLTGYDLSLDDIKQFRQWGSKTPGHPEYGHTSGVETTTGPLGQGVSNAVGMAMAERHLAARFNKPDHSIVDHYTYIMCGDGDMMEGVACEAASLAGHLGLGRLICIYDDNKISIEGNTDIAFTEDVAKRFEAYNWQVLRVADGNDLSAIDAAITAGKAETEKPTIIMLRTHIAYGSPNKQDSHDAHGAPLGKDEIRLTKEALGCPSDKEFYIPEEVKEYFRHCIQKGTDAEAKWNDLLKTYINSFPEEGELWNNALTGVIPADFEAKIPIFKSSDGPIATRAASGKVLNAMAQQLPTLMGGSADLAPSNKTFLNDIAEFQKGNYVGRNIHFGVREHAMGAIMSGLFLHGGIRPYGGTFLVFSDYLRPAVRIASLMKLPVIYVFTHDSVAVGEDGPTHQPVEHLAALRAIPGLNVIRPADANETAQAWYQALKTDDHPTALLLSRQKLPVLDATAIKDGVSKGGYILKDCKGTPQLILIATGAEVHLALAAQVKLEEKDIATRVVNMPSWELFEQCSEEYKQNVLPPEINARLAIEAGISMGWERYVGKEGDMICINTFGASAPGGVVLEKFGFSVTNVVERAVALLQG